METKERRKKKITAEILNLSWGKLFFIIRPDKKVCVMYTTNGIITEVVECHECSNLRRSEMKYSSINKRLFVSVGWKGELVFRHWYFCKEANRRHVERQIFFLLSKSSGSLLFRRWLQTILQTPLCLFSLFSLQLLFRISEYFCSHFGHSIFLAWNNRN